MLPAELIFNIFTSCSEPEDSETFVSPPCSLGETAEAATITSSSAHGSPSTQTSPIGEVRDQTVDSASPWLERKVTKNVIKNVRVEVFIKDPFPFFEVQSLKDLAKNNQKILP